MKSSIRLASRQANHQDTKTPRITKETHVLTIHHITLYFFVALCVLVTWWLPR